MARYSIQVDGEVYHIDAGIEERVKALEEAVLALQEKAGLETSTEIAASLQESRAFTAELEEAERQLQEEEAAIEAEAKAALEAEEIAEDEMEEAFALKREELLMLKHGATQKEVDARIKERKEHLKMLKEEKEKESEAAE